MPKGIDTTLGLEYHNKLLINNNVEINDQRAITIINIPYDGYLIQHPIYKGQPKLPSKAFSTTNAKLFLLNAPEMLKQQGNIY